MGLVYMDELETNITNLYGLKGQKFLDNLPNLIEQIVRKYRLTDLQAVNNMTYHYVLSGFQDSQPIILKLGLDIDGLDREAKALRAFNRFGAVKVLAENDGMLLLERAVSGTSLRSYFPKKDNEAIAITCTYLKQLHQAPIPSNLRFPHIKDWLKTLDQEFNIPEQTLQKARRMRDNLLSSAGASVLLHGDLHHDNILQQRDDWVVIDPKGVIGESAYEVAAFIRNPIPELLKLTNAASMMEHRIHRFAELLDIPERRILHWCFVQAVLAWIWCLQDNGDTSYYQQLTQIFDQQMTV